MAAPHNTKLPLVYFAGLNSPDSRHDCSHRNAPNHFPGLKQMTGEETLVQFDDRAGLWPIDTTRLHSCN